MFKLKLYLNFRKIRFSNFQKFVEIIIVIMFIVMVFNLMECQLFFRGIDDDKQICVEILNFNCLFILN